GRLVTSKLNTKSTARFSRREFLATLGGAAMLTRFGAMNAFAQTSGDYKALVCIFLYGGNDSNDMLVPMSSGYTAYQNVRMGLSIPTNQLLPVTTKSGAAYGLNPGMTDLQPLWSQGKLAAVANVGMLIRPTTRAQYLAGSVAVPLNLFSHGDQQLQW